MIIETDLDTLDVVKAIDTLTAMVNDTARKNNQFASSILDIDLDEAERAIDETGKQLDAAKLLLKFAYDMLGETDELDSSE